LGEFSEAEAEALAVEPRIDSEPYVGIWYFALLAMLRLLQARPSEAGEQAERALSLHRAKPSASGLLISTRVLRSSISRLIVCSWMRSRPISQRQIQGQILSCGRSSPETRPRRASRPSRPCCARRPAGSTDRYWRSPVRRRPIGVWLPNTLPNGMVVSTTVSGDPAQTRRPSLGLRRHWTTLDSSLNRTPK